MRVHARAHTHNLILLHINMVTLSYNGTGWHDTLSIVILC
jgi:hypothetical protein